MQFVELFQSLQKNSVTATSIHRQRGRMTRLLLTQRPRLAWCKTGQLWLLAQDPLAPACLA